MKENKNNEIQMDSLEQVAGGVEVTPELIERVQTHPGYNAQEWDGIFNNGEIISGGLICFLLKNFTYDEACAFIQKYGYKPKPNG